MNKKLGTSSRPKIFWEIDKNWLSSQKKWWNIIFSFYTRISIIYKLVWPKFGSSFILPKDILVLMLKKFRRKMDLFFSFFSISNNLFISQKIERILFLQNNTIPLKTEKFTDIALQILYSSLIFIKINI